jgi:hypothetical protein
LPTFLAVYGFRRPDVTRLENSRRVCGLDRPFTLPRKLRLKCCPSSLYPFSAGSLWAMPSQFETSCAI